MKQLAINIIIKCMDYIKKGNKKGTPTIKLKSLINIFKNYNAYIILE
jgi:hypothetical protein